MTEQIAAITDAETEVADAVLDDVTQPQVEDQAEGEGGEPETEEAKAERKNKTWKERREAQRLARDRTLTELAKEQAKVLDLETKIARLEADAKVMAEPKEADFTDYARYVAALTEWRMDQRSVKRDTDAATAEVGAAKQETARLQGENAKILFEHWRTQADEAATRYADFEAVVAAPGLFPRGLVQVEMIQASDVAADLAYRIASDKPLHDRLMKMHPIEAAREIGRLEATIQGPKPRTSTNAPAPITPVRGAARATLDPAKLSMEAYIEGRKSGKIR